MMRLHYFHDLSRRTLEVFLLSCQMVLTCETQMSDEPHLYCHLGTPVQPARPDLKKICVLKFTSIAMTRIPSARHTLTSGLQDAQNKRFVNLRKQKLYHRPSLKTENNPDAL